MVTVLLRHSSFVCELLYVILLQHLHPAAVHFPIALFLLGSGLALVQIYRPRAFDLILTAWLLLGLGWAGGLVAVLTGLKSAPPS